jgi:hypothetical protein
MLGFRQLEDRVEWWGWGEDDTYHVATNPAVHRICFEVEARGSAEGVGNSAGGCCGCDGHGLRRACKHFTLREATEEHDLTVVVMGVGAKVVVAVMPQQEQALL